MNGTDTRTGTLTIVAPPKFWDEREWDCQVCERESLQHPVFLSDGRVAGTGCAARLLGIAPQTVTRVRDQFAATGRQQDGATAARIARYAAALAEYEIEGTAIVRRGPAADFNALRTEHARRDAALVRPAAFADWLRARLQELAA